MRSASALEAGDFGARVDEIDKAEEKWEEEGKDYEDLSRQEVADPNEEKAPEEGSMGWTPHDGVISPYGRRTKNKAKEIGPVPKRDEDDKDSAEAEEQTRSREEEKRKEAQDKNRSGTETREQTSRSHTPAANSAGEHRGSRASTRGDYERDRQKSSTGPRRT